MAAAAAQPPDPGGPRSAGQAVNPPASAEDLIGGQMDSLVVQAALGLILLFAVFAALASVLTELVTGSWACAANTSCAGIRPSSTDRPLPVGHG
jgi:hypothetical protein